MPRIRFAPWALALLLLAGCATTSQRAIANATTEPWVYPPQNELRRLTAASAGTFSLSYVGKIAQLAPEKREQWLSILRAASLRP